MKTSSKICIIATMILLSGCYQIVNHDDIAIATAWCKDKGGLDLIIEYGTGKTQFKCMNDTDGQMYTHEEYAVKKLFLNSK